jgi:hypothetical protein
MLRLSKLKTQKMTFFIENLFDCAQKLQLLCGKTIKLITAWLAVRYKVRELGQFRTSSPISGLKRSIGGR